MGWYGNGGEQRLSESSAPVTSDFASQLCQDWENAALKAQQHGIRVVLIRTGLVLSTSGGLLGRLLLPFRLGLDGRLGSGQQWMPWIHLQDQVMLIDFLLQQPDAAGPYNASAPQPVRNAEFTRCLAGALRRPAFMHLPAAVLRLGFGELAEMLLAGQQALPERLHEAGFAFRFTELPAALDDLLH